MSPSSSAEQGEGSAESVADLSARPEIEDDLSSTRGHEFDLESDSVPADPNSSARRSQENGRAAAVDYDPKVEERLRENARKSRDTWHYWQRGNRVESVSGPTTFGDGSPAVGRDFVQVFTERRQGARSRPLSEEFLAQLEAEFVEVRLAASRESTSLMRAVDVLRRSGVALVVGRRGSGRSALAIRALDLVRDGTGKVQLFDEGVVPGQIRAEDLEQGNGYVVIGASDVDLRQQARLLCGIAEESGARIVVVGEADSHGWLDRLVVPHDFPDREAVLRRQLRLRFNVDPTLESDLDVALAAVNGCPIAEIERVIELYVGARQQGLWPGSYLHLAVRRQVTSMLTEPVLGPAMGSRSNVEALFLPLYRRAMLLAAAVFHDAPLHVVRQAAEELLARLRGQSVSRIPIPPFADTTEEFLGWLRSELVAPGPEQRPGGRPSPILRFTNRGMPEAILERLWADRHIAAPRLLEQINEWALGLTDLPNEQDWRQRAAMAMGRLASLDFEQTMSHIEQWIQSVTRVGNRAVGWAVQVILGDDELTGEMWRRVEQWSRKDLPFRLAALAVYAESMGTNEVPAALDLVRREVRPLEPIPPITQWFLASVLRRAAEVGETGQAFQVMEEWLDQSEQLSAPLIGTSNRWRVRVAPAREGLQDLLGLTLRVLGDAGDAARPAVLAAVDERADIRTVHDRLWRLAVAWPSSSQAAIDQLGRWLGSADGDPSMERHCRRLVRELLLGRPYRPRLRFAVARWRRDWGDSHPVADSIVRELIDPGEGITK